MEGAAVQGIVNENSTLFEIVDDPVLLQPRNFPLNWTADDEDGSLFQMLTLQITR